MITLIENIYEFNDDRNSVDFAKLNVTLYITYINHTPNIHRTLRKIVRGLEVSFKYETFAGPVETERLIMRSHVQ